MIGTDPVILPLQRPSFADLDGLFTPWVPARVPDPQLVVLNEALAAELDLDVVVLRTPDGVSALVGQHVPAGTVTIAQAYAGHQFGGFSPSLGDGRAVLLGELVDRHGRRSDLHLKGVRRDAVLPRRRRQGRPRADAARAPRVGGDARVGDPHHSRPRRRGDR